MRYLNILEFHVMIHVVFLHVPFCTPPGMAALGITLFVPDLQWSTGVNILPV